MPLESFSLLPLSSAFFIILLAELGDKTQLMTIALAAQHSRLQVALGAFSGEMIVSLLSLGLGVFLGAFLPLNLVGSMAGAAFIALGLFTLLSRKEEGALTARKELGMLVILGIVALAELGDKTQIAVIALVLEHGSPLSVGLGVALAFALLNLMAVMIGGAVAKKATLGLVKRASGLAFIAIGSLLMAGVL